MPPAARGTTFVWDAPEAGAPAAGTPDAPVDPAARAAKARATHEHDPHHTCRTARPRARDARTALAARVEVGKQEPQEVQILVQEARRSSQAVLDIGNLLIAQAGA